MFRLSIFCYCYFFRDLKFHFNECRFHMRYSHHCDHISRRHISWLQIMRHINQTESSEFHAVHIQLCIVSSDDQSSYEQKTV